MKLLAIDPSLTNSGWAYFRDGQLYSCGNVPAPGRHLPDRVRRLAQVMPAIENAEFVFEWPQIYRDTRAKGDPNDLLALAAIVGAVLGAFPRAKATFVRPAEWKGQVPKKIMCARTFKRLNQTEQGLFLCRGYNAEGRGQSEDVLDAIGVGLYHLGR